MLGLRGPGRLALISAARAEDVPRGETSIGLLGSTEPSALRNARKGTGMIVGVMAMAFMVGGLGGLIYRGGWGKR